MFPLLLCVALLACNTERDEARALLDRVEGVDISIPPAKRMPLLTALESLRLGTEELTQLQQLCAGAHRALIEAEVAQAKARHALDTVEGNQDPAKRLDGIDSIASEIERSTQKLEQAQSTFPECERQTRALALRFPTRAR